MPSCAPSHPRDTFVHPQPPSRRPYAPVRPSRSSKALIPEMPLPPHDDLAPPRGLATPRADLVCCPRTPPRDALPTAPRHPRDTHVTPPHRPRLRRRLAPPSRCHAPVPLRRLASPLPACAGPATPPRCPMPPPRHPCDAFVCRPVPPRPAPPLCRDAPVPSRRPRDAPAPPSQHPCDAVPMPARNLRDRARPPAIAMPRAAHATPSRRPCATPLTPSWGSRASPARRPRAPMRPLRHPRDVPRHPCPALAPPLRRPCGTAPPSRRGPAPPS
ncbi:hypothetical protein DENSPDRAFT_886155 [Dentipellis sp. KUC8613]|nr:hypothetical protein DENSPDRAFT_886155 [Dentipellis sp. KUC8613]